MSIDITSEELKTRLDKGEKLTIIDVREPYEHEEFNLGGKLIPLATIAQVVADLEHLKNEEIVIHCRSGARSSSAKYYLQSLGFTNVRNLVGGALDFQMKFGDSQ